ncbi:MAG: rhodanese-like domain-containing protein [Anaeromyxobacter sp.]
MSSMVWLGLGALAVLFVLFRLKGGLKVSSEIVKQKLAAGALILDVRTPGEFAGGAYPGAKNIPVQELGARLSEVPKGKPIVVYCASGMRSASAAALLQRSGYADVVNAGGLGDMPR